eukprot:TRINITY_DN70345_c0_g1_i1.p1 TRINITY_DN70345_c0_g1~~TRINITY_DN70345_c0_g1_i1.p1  ORF type:complete len:281 (+),score=29.45 TRINITY_DN70345_c0_g1_i1:115-957(+)
MGSPAPTAASPEHSLPAVNMGKRVVMTTEGSGPFGERAADVPIFTLDPHPVELDLRAATTLPVPAVRTDLDLGHRTLGFVVDGVLSHAEADALAAASEQIGYSRFAPAIQTPPGMRQNQACHWFASRETTEAFLDPMFARIQHLLPQDIDGSPLCPKLSHRVAHYKYNDGDVFNRHTDGEWPGQSIAESGQSIEVWPGLVSKLSMLLYLNDAEHDGVQGGFTRLFPHDERREPFDVAPKKGSALFFRHGFSPDSVHHMGTEVTGPIPKYVVRLNVLYGDA